MNKKERRQQAILELVRVSDSDHGIRTSDLAQNLNVSEMTIRRDLQELADMGQIQRQHGGVAVLKHEKPLSPLYQVGILLVSRDMKFSDPFFNMVIEGLDCKLQELRCQIAYIRTAADIQTIEQSRWLLETSPVDGIITVGMKRSESMTYLKEHAPKLVAIIDSLGENHDTLTFDGSGGIHKMVDHLHGLGYQRLGFITGHYDSREQGFIDAVIKHRLDDDPALRVSVDCGPDGWTPELGELATEKLLNLEQPPEVIVCASDRLAIGAIQYLHQHDLRVPDDMAVTGLDNIPDSAFIIPPLTTVHVHKKLIGVLAAERLVRRMENPDEVPLQICTPTHLIVRESCGSQLNRGWQSAIR